MNIAEKYLLEFAKCGAVALIILTTCMTAINNIVKARKAIKNTEKSLDLYEVLMPLLSTVTAYALLIVFADTFISHQTFFPFGVILRVITNKAFIWITITVITICMVGEIPYFIIASSIINNASYQKSIALLTCYILAIIAYVAYCLIVPSFTRVLSEFVMQTSAPFWWSLIFGAGTLVFFSMDNIIPQKRKETEDNT